jgi:hypothetical protein
VISRSCVNFTMCTGGAYRPSGQFRAGVFGLTEQFGAAVCAEKLQIDVSSRRIRLLPVTESVVLPPFLWRGTMPAFQSVPDLGLSRKYHLKAIGCEICAEHATDLTTEQQWHGLAVQWHSMADQAAKMSKEASQDELA